MLVAAFIALTLACGPKVPEAADISQSPVASLSDLKHHPFGKNGNNVHNLFFDWILDTIGKRLETVGDYSIEAQPTAPYPPGAVECNQTVGEVVSEAKRTGYHKPEFSYFEGIDRRHRWLFHIERISARRKIILHPLFWQFYLSDPDKVQGIVLRELFRWHLAKCYKHRDPRRFLESRLLSAAVLAQAEYYRKTGAVEQEKSYYPVRAIDESLEFARQPRSENESIAFLSSIYGRNLSVVHQAKIRILRALRRVDETSTVSQIAREHHGLMAYGLRQYADLHTDSVGMDNLQLANTYREVLESFENLQSAGSAMIFLKKQSAESNGDDSAKNDDALERAHKSLVSIIDIAEKELKNLLQPLRHIGSDEPPVTPPHASSPLWEKMENQLSDFDFWQGERFNSAYPVAFLYRHLGANDPEVTQGFSRGAALVSRIEALIQDIPAYSTSKVFAEDLEAVLRPKSIHGLYKVEDISPDDMKRLVDFHYVHQQTFLDLTLHSAGSLRDLQEKIDGINSEQLATFWWQGLRAFSAMEDLFDAIPLDNTWHDSTTFSLEKGKVASLLDRLGYVLQVVAGHPSYEMGDSGMYLDRVKFLIESYEIEEPSLLDRNISVLEHSHIPAGALIGDNLDNSLALIQTFEVGKTDMSKVVTWLTTLDHAVMAKVVYKLKGFAPLYIEAGVPSLRDKIQRQKHDINDLMFEISKAGLPASEFPALQGYLVRLEEIKAVYEGPDYISPD